MKVQCPTCGASVEWIEKNPWRPFCTERCKLIDLGEWASGSYQIPSEEFSSNEEYGSDDVVKKDG